MKKICIVTGSRAEYGLLYWIIRKVHEDQDLELQLVVTGMHLSNEFGRTEDQIIRDGFPIAYRVDSQLSSDSKYATAKSTGIGVMGFSDCYRSLQPDIVLVLGDRFEILAAVTAAMLINLPVAHLHGGEVTEGAIDESIRHSITKMANLHFVAADAYRQRVIQMGENPSFVMNLGSPGIECLRRLPVLSKKQIENDIPFKFRSVNFLVTYHPVTRTEAKGDIDELFHALDDFPDAGIVITKPNADSNNRPIVEAIDRYADLHRDRVFTANSLGSLRYINIMRAADVVIGNSSSGLTEAPALRVPTVNIGTRQKGRLRPASVIDCDVAATDISQAIRRALTPEFKSQTQSCPLVYDGDNVSVKIVDVLKKATPEQFLIKRFHDL